MEVYFHGDMRIGVGFSLYFLTTGIELRLFQFRTHFLTVLLLLMIPVCKLYDKNVVMLY